MTRTLQTNRDLYLAIEELSKQYNECDRSLESYLLTVLDQSALVRDRELLTLSELYELIASGFTAAPATFDDSWREQYDHLPHEEESYTGWHGTVVRQIVDLREMAECGTLSNDMRFFGMSAPRKSYWYNFDPIGYLECAMAGSFGGWQPGDDTGRDYVPGPVVVFTHDGSTHSANPEDLPNPIIAIPTVTWEDFKGFMICGQIYE